jgi:anti-anti-sigma factor
MEIKHQMIGSTLLFKCHDPVFNEVSIIQYKRNLAALIEKNPVRDIILDVENVRITDNFGLSALMFARRYTRANGNTCYLAMPRPKLLSLLKTSRLMDSFSVFNRREEYQAYLKSLVEKQEQEKAEREAEKARRAEEARKAEEMRKAAEAAKAPDESAVGNNVQTPSSENVTAQAKNGTRKPRRRNVKKNGNKE